jgi:hypothetical protein
MKRIRFTISSLLIAVPFAGFGFAALREANETWDSNTFSITLAALLISILLAVHLTNKRRAYWLGFALFGSAYLGLSLIPSIESQLITTKALAFLDSKVPRSIPAGFVYTDFDNDGRLDLCVANNSQPHTLYPNKGTFVFEDVTANAGLNPAGNQGKGSGILYLDNLDVNNSAGLWLRGSVGTTKNFMRIGHSLMALVAASLGGHISRRLYANNREAAKESIVPERSTSSDRSWS